MEAPKRTITAKPKMTKEVLQKVHTLWRQGYGVNAIGKEIGYSHQAVRKQIKKQGWEEERSIDVVDETWETPYEEVQTQETISRLLREKEEQREQIKALEEDLAKVRHALNSEKQDRKSQRIAKDLAFEQQQDLRNERNSLKKQVESLEATLQDTIEQAEAKIQAAHISKLGSEAPVPLADLFEKITPERIKAEMLARTWTDARGKQKKLSPNSIRNEEKFLIVVKDLLGVVNGVE